jgi:hypothetical protein
MDDRSNRAQMESDYRSFFSMGTVSPPGLQRLSDENLNGKLAFLRRASAAAEDIRRRAAPGLTRLREEQALVLGSDVSVREWMDVAMTKWADGGGSSAFHPFAAAVELYGHPLPGLQAEAERHDGIRRAWLLDVIETHRPRLQHDLPFDYE